RSVSPHEVLQRRPSHKFAIEVHWRAWRIRRHVDEVMLSRPVLKLAVVIGVGLWAKKSAASRQSEHDPQRRSDLAHRRLHLNGPTPRAPTLAYGPGSKWCH